MSLGRLKAGPLNLRCALGRSGMSRAKREGDGATPLGCMRLVEGFFRADRIVRPRCLVPMRPLRPIDGWCDEPGTPRYNRPVTLPAHAGHEMMWRGDGLYDVVLVLDYNLSPRRQGRGSAIFLHCARPGLGPTQGCVALSAADMRRLLPRLARKVMLVMR